MKPISVLTAQLADIAEDEFTIDRVEETLRSSPVDPASLAPYVHFQPTHYTRNLIHRGPLFELMAICWEVGQASPIHNHAGQNCWMATPIGRLAIQNYEILETNGREYCRLGLADRQEMDAARPAHVAPERPVHAVLNLAEYASRAVSLHVYSRPYDRCLVYSLETSTCREVPLFFDTEYGRGVPSTVV